MTAEARAALPALRRAVAAAPASADLLARLGVALRQLGEDAEAEQRCREALAIRPDEPDALGCLGGLLQLQGRFDDAIALAEAALAARPDSGAAWLLRGDSLANSARPDLALAAYERAALQPMTAFEAVLRAGKVLRGQGRADAALAAFESAIALDPQSAQAVYERGALRLQSRRFAEGWPDYESRWRWERFVAGSRGFVPVPMIPHLALNPTAGALAGQRVLVVGEQGIGDQLMFASMLPDLARVATSVLCLAEPRLLRLLSASMPAVTFMNPSGASIDGDSIDVALALGSLGAAFRRDASDFPGEAYVRPRPEVTGRWAERLGPRRARLRVGLSWRGGVASSNRLARSVDLARLGAILDRGDCEFVSLQYGDVAAEIAAVNTGRAAPIRTFSPGDLHDFEDFAGLVENLDVVVSVQNATVHLAGALGKRCLAMLPSQAEWRYMREGPAMPWYRSVRLLRQPTAGDWESVTAAAAAELAT